MNRRSHKESLLALVRSFSSVLKRENADFAEERVGKTTLTICSEQLPMEKR